MEEDYLVESFCEISGRHAILADDGRTGVLFLHAPSANPTRTNRVTGDCFAYNRVKPIEVKDVEKCRPDAPPIAKGYASAKALCRDPHNNEWWLVWSNDGEAVLLMRNEEPWCIISPNNAYGYSKAIRTEGPWGKPWSDSVYRSIMWNVEDAVAARGKPLRRNESGPYADLRSRPNPRRYVIAFMPSLASWLGRAEEQKKADLSPMEVMRIRDGAPAIAITRAQLSKLVASRGYEDVDPGAVYESWMMDEAHEWLKRQRRKSGAGSGNRNASGGHSAKKSSRAKNRPNVGKRRKPPNRKP